MGYDNTKKIRGDTEMHISEGVLSAPVLISGAILTIGGTYLGLKKVTERDIPKVGILSSAFFVASLVHVPLGPTSVHLILNGLNGLLLGWMAFPSILVALFLQGILFQFGGLTTLGINTFNMAFPAVLSYFFFRRLVLSDRSLLSSLGGFLIGAFSVALAGFLVALVLALKGEGFLALAKLVFIAHLPVMVIEGLISSVVLLFVKRVNPKVLASVLVFLLVFFSLSDSCLAHKVKTFAYLDDSGKVITRTYFSSGEGVKGARVWVYDNVKGELILEGKTDEDGNFAFNPPPGVSEIKITVEADLGHKSQALLSLNEGRSLPSGSSEVKIQNPEELSRLIDEKLKPIRDSLFKIEERLSKPSITEIVGGIGYIFGVFGILAMVLARRRGN
ncbi:MAG: cobalt transporter CbiM [Synergistota bacterium]|nr:cobalt transporter CbiM [Synergistota bacterium]